MINRLLKTIFLFFMTVFILTGCQRKQKNELDVLAREPNLATINVQSDYAAEVIESSGGLDAWIRTLKLQFNCVVTFYRPDGSLYLTEQQFTVYPWSNSVEIFGQEPDNTFAWRLSQGRFEVLQGKGHIINSKNVVDNQCYAETIKDIITAPVRLLDQSVEFTKVNNPIKIQGQWYGPIVRNTKTSIESILRIPKAVFYQNKDRLLIDMIWIACPARSQFLIVRGYDYHKIEENGLTIPNRIEIYSTDSEGDLQERLVKIDLSYVEHSL